MGPEYRPSPAPFKHVFELRDSTNTILHAMRRSQPTPESVREIRIPSASHNVAGDVEIYALDIKRMVESSGMPFFAVEYRLAPEFPGGVAAEVLFHGQRNLSAHAAAWNVNARAVLGEEAGRPESEVPLYVAPGRAGVEDLLGLPKTYVGVSSLDLFRDECMNFVGRLARADVEGRVVRHSICFAGVTSTVLTMFQLLFHRCRQQQPTFIR
ncbi:uncharacterized protein LY79DRAFT_594200 [Colletotrichum navitas]|uniref:Uncharacterized protein n=1 Tax=Colletotrichum navitas TaxID=681940 RepID=A0AAD8PNI0_9PEZI|nr:uncharacterized protein LY79DRAFT_594200 [Colletotrichum navitas]KAK1572991.1 hypothetical protein LY79DRAFT_594200 [Colletotrichum navitas]